MIILKSGSVFRTATAGGAAAGTSNERYIDALGDYGTALGVMLQLIDDCRDVFTQSQEIMTWEVSLPLLLYLMTIGEENICFPEVGSRAEWGEMLRKMGVLNAISSLLIEWKTHALESLEPLEDSQEKHILESIPSLILERIPVNSIEVPDGNST
jgi:geranylgeranyl pyrophosphate synthase